MRRAVRRRGSVVAGVFALSLIVGSAGVVAAGTGGHGRRAAQSYTTVDREYR